MKGIILAGGTGTRLWPTTKAVSKQLLPIYNKPIIFYPLTTLMLAGIRDILIITTSQDQASFKKLLGNGEQLGISLTYQIQDQPNGIAEAFILGKEFIADDSVALILGDNFFYGADLKSLFVTASQNRGASIFVTGVSNPSDYGVVEIDAEGIPIAMEEKPKNPKSNLAITGLYFLDSSAVGRAEKVKPSKRGELEITDVLNSYLADGELLISYLSRGSAWLDTGTPNSLHDASSFVKVVEERTGTKIGCPEEVAWRNTWIDSEELMELADSYRGNEYGDYLRKLATECQN